MQHNALLTHFASSCFVIILSSLENKKLSSLVINLEEQNFQVQKKWRNIPLFQHCLHAELTSVDCDVTAGRAAGCPVCHRLQDRPPSDVTQVAGGAVSAAGGGRSPPGRGVRRPQTAAAAFTRPCLSLCGRGQGTPFFTGCFAALHAAGTAAAVFAASCGSVSWPPQINSRPPLAAVQQCPVFTSGAVVTPAPFRVRGPVSTDHSVSCDVG